MTTKEQHWTIFTDTTANHDFLNREDDKTKAISQVAKILISVIHTYTMNCLSLSLL